MEEIYQRVEEALAKEDIRYKEHMERMKQNERKVTVRPVTDFIGQIDEVKEILVKCQKFTEELDSNPRRVFTGAAEILDTNRIILNTAMGTVKRDYQYYLADIANSYLQDWLEEHGNETKYMIQVKQASSYPSNYAVYTEGKEVLTFSLLKKWYGMRKEGYTEDVLKVKYDKELQRLKEEHQKNLEELDDWKNREEKPRKAYKGFKNWVALTFKKKKVREGFGIQIAKVERKVEYSLTNVVRYERFWETKKEMNDQLVNVENELKPFFEELGYTRKENKHELY